MFLGVDGADQCLPLFGVAVARLEVRSALSARKILNTPGQLHLVVCQSALVRVAGPRRVVLEIRERRVSHRVVECVLVVIEHHYCTALLQHHVLPEGTRRDLHEEDSLSRFL